MKQNARLIFASITLAAAILASGCSSCPLMQHGQGKVHHAVFIWLKHPGNAAEREKLIDAARMFKREIAEIESLDVGQMLPSKRPIVDSTYDVGFVMRFASKEAMDRYEQNPIHQQTVKDLLMPLASKVQVYDFVAE